jgi:hypothetical protein
MPSQVDRQKGVIHARAVSLETSANNGSIAQRHIKKREREREVWILQRHMTIRSRPIWASLCQDRLWKGRRRNQSRFCRSRLMSFLFVLLFSSHINHPQSGVKGSRVEDRQKQKERTLTASDNRNLFLFHVVCDCVVIMLLSSS